MVDEKLARDFLKLRIALVGASDDERAFSKAVYKALRAHAVDVVPVNPNANQVDGERCWPDLASVPGVIGGVMVMVAKERAAVPVRDAIELGVRKVWFFRGFGAGSMSDEALEDCVTHDVEVVPGACPLMFLDPVTGIHRLHRAARRFNGGIAAC